MVLVDLLELGEVEVAIPSAIVGGVRGEVLQWDSEVVVTESEGEVGTQVELVTCRASPIAVLIETCVATTCEF